MNSKIPRSGKLTGIAAAAALLVTAGCTATGSTDNSTGDINSEVDWLDNAVFASYSSCDEALDSLQDNALDLLEEAEDQGDAPVGAPEEPEFAPEGDRTDDAEAAQELSGEEYSETNVAEAGVDEPDVVKTDGDRIYALVGNTLQIADVDSEEIQATIDFVDDDLQYSEAGMFLDGDSVMVMHKEFDSFEIRPQKEATGPELVVNRIDVSGDPTMEDQMRFDGTLLDARMVDGQARIVASSEPHFQVPELYDDEPMGPRGGMDSLEEAIGESSVEDWLPTYQVNGEELQVPCQGVAHPEEYTGMSMLTLLTLPMGDDGFGTGDPVSIAAEADTVYGTSDSIYVVNGHSTMGTWIPRIQADDSDDETEIYRFTYSNDGPPVFAGDTVVPGYLVNQYSLNEFNGHLRVATTEGNPWATVWDETADASESTLTVLEIGDDSMKPVGSVTGLGPEERIYSVRFMEEMAYIVTFRDTDPLYTIDVSDPTEPDVTGELDITGYSSYLHPVEGDKLIGVGQEATLEGQTMGTLVSLFDISGDEAVVDDQHFVEDSHSVVENDPHAFLYWEPRDLVTLPISERSNGAPKEYLSVLQIDDDELSEVNTVAPENANDPDQPWEPDMGMRSLVIGDNLWTLSSGGLISTDLDSHEVQAQLEWNRD